MKFIELCRSPDLGGLELYAFRCTEQLSRNHEVMAVVAPGSRLEGYLEEKGLRRYPIDVRFRPLPLLAARRLARLIDAERIDVVHMHWGKDLALAALAKALSRRKPKLVYTRQMQITRPKRDRYHDFLYGQVDLILTITESLAEAMRRFLNPAYAGRVRPLHYGVAAPADLGDGASRRALRAELGIADETFLVGLFGRIKHYKGQHLLVEAMAQAKAEGRPLAGLIVGGAMEPDYLDRLKRRTADERLPVLFRDFVRDPQRLMRACDCVVLTTVEETFGLVLVEAMRAGVAVVGSDRGGVPEIIDHEKTGLLFRSTDGDDLYRQLVRLAEDRAFCGRLAAAGQAKADRDFDEAAHFARLDAIFAGLSRTAV